MDLPLGRQWSFVATSSPTEPFKDPSGQWEGWGHAMQSLTQQTSLVLETGDTPLPLSAKPKKPFEMEFVNYALHCCNRRKGIFISFLIEPITLAYARI